MIHPLLRLVVKEPHLLADHLSAYAFDTLKSQFNADLALVREVSTS